MDKILMRWHPISDEQSILSRERGRVRSSTMKKHLPQYSIEGMQNDVERDEYLRRLGQEVVRYSNTEILQNENGVTQDIFEHVKLRFGLHSDSL